MPFDDLPEANKTTMLAVCNEIYERHIESLQAENKRINNELDDYQILLAPIVDHWKNLTGEYDK